MSREEYHELPWAADTFEHELAIRLMGDCGLRVAEVLDVRPEHVDRMSDGRHYELEVVGGKDTTGEYDGGKHRETWLPVEFGVEGDSDIRSDLVASLVRRTPPPTATVATVSGPARGRSVETEPGNADGAVRRGSTPAAA